jgi:3-keto-5-aminohexanoate cleavage enzyme
MFAVIGAGPFPLPMNAMRILLGGHAGVGMEDNMYYREGERLKSNAQQVARVKRIALEMNREIATVAQAREMLGLPARKD